MRNLNEAGNLKQTRGNVILYSVLIFSILSFGIQTFAQDTIQAGHAFQADKYSSEKRKSSKINSFSFGGNGLLFTRVNNQNTIMTGGRGFATINNRYTIGGGGWGMVKGVDIDSESEGIYSFAKMGYGGVDVGYLIFPGEKLMLGTKLLIAGGAVFKETVPESKDKSFKIFPVLEPDLYYQISLSKIFRFEMGASYRFIRGTGLQYISDRQLSGFSVYVGFLIRT